VLPRAICWVIIFSASERSALAHFCGGNPTMRISSVVSALKGHGADQLVTEFVDTTTMTHIIVSVMLFSPTFHAAG